MSSKTTSSSNTHLPQSEEPGLGPLATEADIRGTPLAFRSVYGIVRDNWHEGSLSFILPNGRVAVARGSEPGPQAVLIIHDFRVVARGLASGDIGLGEAFIAGECDSPDIAALLEGFSANYDRLASLVDGNIISRLFHLISHAFNANSRRGSQRNIMAHYDLGNQFYSRWLDKTMTYSAACFESPDQSLSQAQNNKYAALARSMALRPDHHVLEIGCGWGGFAEYAAGVVGAKVTAITISPSQRDFAAKRIFDLGLAERASIQLIDYRDVQGEFDRVASIEMFEAVGEAYWPSYFSKVHGCLKPGGQAGLQIITIQDQLFEGYRRRSDFIQKYIFPGGMLPSEARLRQEITRAGLSWGPVFRFGQNYADTLAQWAHRFEDAWDDIRHLGFDERFRRLWRFYLGYCEAGFRTGRTDVIQLSVART
jgi:cyclopropane-fatty-acyl-phospholipid synthase